MLFRKELFRKNTFMMRLNLAYYYEMGAVLHPLGELPFESKLSLEYLMILNNAKKLLFSSINQNLFYSSYNAAANLLGQINSILDEYATIQDKEKTFKLYEVKNQARNFEAAYKAELQISNSYLVTPKGGYSIDVLTQFSENSFPPNLLKLVPNAEHDVEQAARCLAFENPTAAGFHLMRILESVIQKYWFLLTNGSKKPKNKNMGAYLSALQGISSVDPKILATLKQIKDLHRNPIAHPDKNLTVEEAINLYGIIRSAIGYLLEEINKFQTNKTD